MELHSTLEKLLKRLKLDEHTPPDQKQWQKLLQRVNSHYVGADEDRYMLERSLKISSKEMQSLYENLRFSSEQKLSQAQSKLETVMDSLIDGVCEIDLNGKIVFFNEGLRHILSCTEEDLTGKKLSEIVQFSEATLQTEYGFSEALYTAEVIRDDSAMLGCAKMNPVPVSCVLSPILGGGQLLGYVALLRDMQAQMDVQKQLHKAKELAEEVAMAKSDFLATMSHEIRTPLNGVIGLSELLKATSLDATQIEYVDTLGRSAETLLRLVNDILDFSKIESGKMVLEKLPFSPGALMEDMTQMFKAQFVQKRIALVADVDDDLPETLVGDRHRLAQVLINLIGNALKFTQQGEVAVRFHAHENSDHSRVIVNVEVQDSGIGISEEGQRNLFQPFMQADSSTTRNFGGTGLGLAISHKLVAMMGGNLQVRSQEGQGSCFYFQAEFEINTVQEEKTSSYTPAVKIEDIDLSQLKVLLVEDNKVNQLLAGKLLNKFELHYDLAENGEQAVEKMQQNRYNLVLMDCQMPVMDGYEATRTWRKQDAKHQLPIIGLTANALDGDREKCIACGMDDYLTKPIQIDKFQESIWYWISQSVKNQE